MEDRHNDKQSVKTLRANLKRLEQIIKGPHVRPADYAIRDRLARRLRDAG